MAQKRPGQSCTGSRRKGGLHQLVRAVNDGTRYVTKSKVTGKLADRPDVRWRNDGIWETHITKHRGLTCVCSSSNVCLPTCLLACFAGTRSRPPNIKLTLNKRGWRPRGSGANLCPILHIRQLLYEKHHNQQLQPWISTFENRWGFPL